MYFQFFGLVNDIESECPESNQQIAPALMPESTVPFSYADFSSLSTPTRRHTRIIRYQKSNEPLFPERAFFELKNAQSVVVAFDGTHPLPATYCYLKPDFLPVAMTWFEQERINFDPGLIERSI
jgi:hypothetical protein